MQVASEWPELRGRRPSKTVSDRTTVRLRAGHALTVTETGLASPIERVLFALGVGPGHAPDEPA
ncbi:hypothetical protein [Streptomyces sp. NPDC056821]|uniref:hypothetical protein n=1 Tax=unclassified Streptomyces TaxID=2593676 RepID=UPI0036C1040E